MKKTSLFLLFCSVLSWCYSLSYDSGTAIDTNVGTQTNRSTTTYSGGQTFQSTVTITGAGSNALLMQASGGGSIFGILIRNTNTAASSDARLGLRVDGTSAGDPFVMFQIVNGAAWALGGDTSDSDKFKISMGTSLGTNDVVSIDSVTFNSAFLLGSVTLYNRTLAELQAITPVATGEQYNCSNCATTPVCISTGTSIAAFSGLATKTTVCQ